MGSVLTVYDSLGNEIPIPAIKGPKGDPGETGLPSVTEADNGKVLGVVSGEWAKMAQQDISGKQDVISDLNTIRSGAALGATAIQSHQDISGKLDKNQGAAHAGQFLVVGNDGNVTTVTMTTWQGGSY